MGTIKHSKVSGVANTGASVGGADWDANHVETGLRLVGIIGVDDATYTAAGVSVGCFSKDSTGYYEINMAAAGLPVNYTEAVLSVEMHNNDYMQTGNLYVDSDNGTIYISIKKWIANEFIASTDPKFRVSIYRFD